MLIHISSSFNFISHKKTLFLVFIMNVFYSLHHRSFLLKWENIPRYPAKANPRAKHYITIYHKEIAHAPHSYKEKNVLKFSKMFYLFP